MCAVDKLLRKRLRMCVICFTNTRGSRRSKQKTFAFKSHLKYAAIDLYLAPSAHKISVLRGPPSAPSRSEGTKPVLVIKFTSGMPALRAGPARCVGLCRDFTVIFMQT